MKNDEKSDKVGWKRLRLDLETVKMLSVKTGMRAGGCGEDTPSSTVMCRTRPTIQ